MLTSGISCEQTIINALKDTQEASKNGFVMHLALGFTSAPTPELGVFVCLVTAPDEVVREIHGKTDSLIKDILAKHNLEVIPKQ
jgi:hypothetical protein